MKPIFYETVIFLV